MLRSNSFDNGRFHTREWAGSGGSAVNKAVGNSTLTSQSLFAGSGQMHLSPKAPFDLLSHGYRSQWAYSCISLRSGALSRLKWKVYNENSVRGQDESVEVQNDHWLVRLLKNPNGFLVRSLIYRLIWRWLDVNGNAYIYTPRVKGQLEMWPLPSNRVQIIVGGPETDKLILGYTYWSAQGPVFLPAEEVLHLKNLEPDANPECSLFLGKSLMIAAQDALEVDIASLRYQARYFENDATPPFVILEPAEMNPDEFRQFKDRWNQTFMGSDNAGKWALLEGGKQVQILQTGGRLQEMQALDPATQKRVCAVFGMSPALVSSEFANYATAKELRAEFHESTIFPIAEYVGEEFTRHFSRYEKGIIVEPVPYTYSDPATELARTQFNFDHGVLTINDLLKIEGKPTIGPDGDVRYLNGTPLDQVNNPPKPAPIVVPSAGVPGADPAPADGAAAPEEEEETQVGAKAPPPVKKKP